MLSGVVGMFLCDISVDNLERGSTFRRLFSCLFLTTSSRKASTLHFSTMFGALLILSAHFVGHKFDYLKATHRIFLLWKNETATAGDQQVTKTLLTLERVLPDWLLSVALTSDSFFRDQVCRKSFFFVAIRCLSRTCFLLKKRCINISRKHNCRHSISIHLNSIIIFKLKRREIQNLTTEAA